jgi:threonine synthase
MPKNNVVGLKCTICGEEYELDQLEYICPKHGLRGNLDVLYDYDKISESLTKKALEKNSNLSMWRYLDLLPIKNKSLIPPPRIGWTPVYRAVKIEKQFGTGPLWIKDDGLNPTCSYKDRASAIAVVKAIEKKRLGITCASSGNAAASLAGISASSGLDTYLFVPEKAPEGKIAQMLIFGATVMLVEGTYDDAYELSLKVSEKYGWYSRNSGYNPYLSEGKKTGALEICEQMKWNPPDNIFVAVGDGCIIGGIWKGIKDLVALGFIEAPPKIFGVQAEGSAALAKAWRSGSENIVPIASPDTLADSISVGIPRDPLKALRAVRESNGRFVTVSDGEILESMRILARGIGVFSEPAAAAALAGALKLTQDNILKPDDKTVVFITGNGLKDIKNAIKATGSPYKIKPTLEDVYKITQLKKTP